MISNQSKTKKPRNKTKPNKPGSMQISVYIFWKFHHFIDTIQSIDRLVFGEESKKKKIARKISTKCIVFVCAWVGDGVPLCVWYLFGWCIIAYIKWIIFISCALVKVPQTRNLRYDDRAIYTYTGVYVSYWLKFTETVHRVDIARFDHICASWKSLRSYQTKRKSLMAERAQNDGDICRWR